jgi:hypothetical protein
MKREQIESAPRSGTGRHCVRSRYSHHSPPDTRHPGLFGQIRLKPTNSDPKKIKSPLGIFPSAFICVHLRLKIPFPIPEPRRAHSCIINLFCSLK